VAQKAVIPLPAPPILKKKRKNQAPLNVNVPLIGDNGGYLKE
jgi:hypothetical protein